MKIYKEGSDAYTNPGKWSLGACKNKQKPSKRRRNETFEGLEEKSMKNKVTDEAFRD